MGNLANFNLVDWLETLAILVIAITIHEFAHAYAADRLGDLTPRSQGRITLSPLAHLDPIGSLMMAISAAIGIGIGWGRPVQYNPSNLRHPRWDPLKIAVWGPISNVLQAIVLAIGVRTADRYNWCDGDSIVYQLMTTGVWINIALALFNMIPIPPLDGSKVLSAVLPNAQSRRYDQVMGQWGILFFFAIVFTGATAWIIGPPLNALYHTFIGW